MTNRYIMTPEERLRGSLKSKPNLHSKPSNQPETRTDMFTTVWRTRVRCKTQHVYHSNKDCKRLRTGKTILKGRLGSVLAAGYKKHC